MIEPRHLRDRVVRPVLEHLGLWSLAAEQLVMGTAAQESRFTYLQQIGSGPALGLWQMEPATHDDIWNNFLAYKPVLRQAVAEILGAWPDRTRALASNLAYGAAMCRVHYFRSPRGLPGAGDVAGMAALWKKVYNTPLGAGTEEEFWRNWRACKLGELYGLAATP